LIYPLEITADGIAKVLAGYADGGARHADDEGSLVEQLEGPVVDVDLVQLEVAGQLGEEMSHCEGFLYGFT